MPLPQKINPQDFVFNDTLLEWNPTNLPALKGCALPTTFTSLNQYHKAFIPLIFMETKAILQQGLEKHQINKWRAVTWQVQAKETAKKPDIPITLTLSGRFPKEMQDSGTSGLALQLTINDTAHMGLLCYIDHDDTYKVKVKLNQNASNLRLQQRINVRFLGSVLLQQRMYQACVNLPKLAFDPLLLDPTRHHDYAWSTNNFESTVQYQQQSKKMTSIDHLNISQAQAVISFLQNHCPLQCWQGPPGTGKTTTILALLNNLIQRQQRVLVSAPSNQAVQVIASRFYKQQPDVPMVLIGIEAKLSEDLRDIFIHGWAQHIAKHLRALTEPVISQITNVLLSSTPVTTKTLYEPINFYHEALKKAEKNLMLRVPLFFSQFLKRDFQQLATKIENIFIDFPTKIQPLPEEPQKEYQTWVTEQTKNITNSITKIIGKLRQNSASIEQELIQQAQFIFMTLCVSGRRHLRMMKKVDVVIVDEAAQATEAETRIVLQHGPKQCLLVGDTNQLPATVVWQQAPLYSYDNSLMTRLEASNFPQNRLTVQYRMHPDIRQWPSQRFYDNVLTDGANIILRVPTLAKNPFKPYSFFNIAGQEKKTGHSYTNPKEAECVVNVVRCLHTLLAVPVEQKVAIITFYVGQKILLQKMLQEASLPSVRVKTVDGFQGGEKTIIIISFVRANRRVGFLRDYRRLNVALTRAQECLIMLGHEKTLHADNNISLLLDDAKKRGVLFDAKKLKKIINPRPQFSTQEEKEALDGNNTHTSTRKVVTLSSRQFKKNQQKKKKQLKQRQSNQANAQTKPKTNQHAQTPHTTFFKSGNQSPGNHRPAKPKSKQKKQRQVKR